MAELVIVMNFIFEMSGEAGGSLVGCAAAKTVLLLVSVLLLLLMCGP